MITQLLFRALDRKAVWLVAALLAVAILVPVLNLAVELPRILPALPIPLRPSISADWPHDPRR